MHYIVHSKKQDAILPLFRSSFFFSRKDVIFPHAIQKEHARSKEVLIILLFYFSSKTPGFPHLNYAAIYHGQLNFSMDLKLAGLSSYPASSLSARPRRKAFG